jgi:putative peptidoglycan lipid II flippase
MSSTMGRAALVVSGGILLSRILGFVREMVLAALLGRTIEADLYQAAFTVPDFLFFLMAGGYLTITFVPIVSRHLAAGEEDEANRAFTAIARVVGGLMLVATVVTLIAARPITERLFVEIPDERMPQLVGLVRIILPAQFFFVLGSLYMAVQYAHQRFLIPTLAPIVYNLAIIAGGTISWLVGSTGPEGFVLGALAGAIVGNFALQWWGAHRVGLRWQPGTPFRHPAVGEYFALALPLMIGQSAVGLDEVFFRIFGQFGTDGDIAAINYARRLNMVPIGVIAQAAGVASFPFLARLFAEGRRDEMERQVDRAVRSGLVVSGLATAVVIALATPMVAVAFQRGTFDLADTLATAPLVAIYGISIPMWTAHQVYTRAFYAQRRMWLPVVVGTAITVAALPSYYFASMSYGATGVVATSVGVMVAYAAVMGWLWHRGSSAREVARSGWQALVAGVPAGAAAWAVSRLTTGGEPPGTLMGIAVLILGGALAAGVYWAVLRAMGSPELEAILRRRRQRGSPR